MGRGEQVLSFVPDSCGRAREAARQVGGPAVCASESVDERVCVHECECMYEYENACVCRCDCTCVCECGYGCA